MWCSGKVMDVEPKLYATFPKGKSATIMWDANDRVDPPAEPISVLACKLLPCSLWNKDRLRAWRVDLGPPPPPPIPLPCPPRSCYHPCPLPSPVACPSCVVGCETASVRQAAVTW